MSKDDKVLEFPKQFCPSNASGGAYLLMDGVPVEVGLQFPIRNEDTDEEAVMLVLAANGPAIPPGSEIILLPHRAHDAWQTLEE